jgi:hypothetical protein
MSDRVKLSSTMTAKRNPSQDARKDSTPGMSQGIDWGLWLTLCALLAAGGMFLDEYHVKDDARSRIRGKLIAMFVFLDKPYLYDFPRAFYNKISDSYKNKGWIRRMFFGIVCYLATVSLFYLAWHIKEKYISYIFKPITDPFTLALILWVLCVGAVSFAAMRAFLERWNRSSRITTQFMILILALVVLVMFVLGGGLGFLMLGLLWPEENILIIDLHRPTGNILPWFFSLVSVWHYIALVLIMLLLTFVRGLYLLVHWFFLNVLDAASSPDTSPFRYLGALLALLVVGLKVVVELTN